MEEAMAWTNGVQGLLTLLITFHHARLTFHPTEMIQHFDVGTGLMWQTPIIETLLSSQFLLYLSFIVSGYSLSVRHFSSMYQGHQEQWQMFRHIGWVLLHKILVLVATVLYSTYITYYLWMMGSYELINAGKVGTQWARDISVKAERRDWKEVATETIRSFFLVWFDPSQASKYNPAQWILPSQIVGSSMVCLFMIFSVSLGTWKRQLFGYFLVVVLLMSSWMGAALFLVGGLLADVHTRQIFSNSLSQHRSSVHGVYSNILSLYLGVFACFVISFPVYHSINPMTEGVYAQVQMWFKDDALRIGQLFSSLGAVIMFPAIMISTDCRRFLSHDKLCSLGDLSLSLYFTHLPILLGIGSLTYRCGEMYGVEKDILWFVVHPIWLTTAVGFAWLITIYIEDFSNFLNGSTFTRFFTKTLFLAPPAYEGLEQSSENLETISIVIDQSYLSRCEK